MIEEYVSRIEEACGEGQERDFIIILKYAKREEAMEKILAKCKVDRTLSGVLVMGRYNDTAVSIFRTGKLIIKGLEKRGEAEDILNELLL